MRHEVKMARVVQRHVMSATLGINFANEAK
jgi:hypothetical protein